jgi:hypothetical protein
MREHVETGFAVVRDQIERVNIPATLFEILPEPLEEARGVAEPMK